MQITIITNFTELLNELNAQLGNFYVLNKHLLS